MRVVRDADGLVQATVTEERDEVREGFDEADHPRGDNGRFIDKEDIETAKHDPEVAAELRSQVTDPKQRAKLDAMIGDKGGKGEKGEKGDKPKAGPEKALPSTGLPSDDELASADITPITGTGAVSEAAGIARVTVGGKPYFFKAVHPVEAGREAAVGDLAALAGVPAPAGRVAKLGDKDGLLATWVGGKRADADKAGFEKAVVDDPKAATRMATFNFLVGAQDKSTSNYMVNDGKVISIDHGEALGTFDPKASRVGLGGDEVIGVMAKHGIQFDPESLRDVASKADAMVAHLKAKGLTKEAAGVEKRAALLGRLAADGEPSEAKLRALLGDPGGGGPKAEAGRAPAMPTGDELATGEVKPIKPGVDKVTLGGKAYALKTRLQPDRVRSEQTVSELASLAGVNVPKSISTSARGAPATATEWVEGRTLAGMTSDERKEFMARVPKADIDRQVLFDYLLGHGDVHNGNFIAGSDGHLHGIDKELWGHQGGWGSGTKLEIPHYLADATNGYDTLHTLDRSEVERMVSAGVEMANHLESSGDKKNAVGVRNRVAVLKEFAKRSDSDLTVGNLKIAGGQGAPSATGAFFKKLFGG
jgi:tRNA A-37 threonylcarbamoyl transferase component Bud32